MGSLYCAVVFGLIRSVQGQQVTVLLFSMVIITCLANQPEGGFLLHIKNNNSTVLIALTSSLDVAQMLEVLFYLELSFCISLSKCFSECDWPACHTGEFILMAYFIVLLVKYRLH